MASSRIARQIFTDDRIVAESIGGEHTHCDLSCQTPLWGVMFPRALCAAWGRSVWLRRHRESSPSSGQPLGVRSQAISSADLFRQAGRYASAGSAALSLCVSRQLRSGPAAVGLSGAPNAASSERSGCLYEPLQMSLTVTENDRLPGGVCGILERPPGP